MVLDHANESITRFIAWFFTFTNVDRPD